LQDDAVRVLQLNAAGTGCDGSTGTRHCIAAGKVARAAEI
jgi:hypothetical protein